MSLKIQCDMCGGELMEPGGVLFSPPISDGFKIRKIHACIVCWDILMDFMFITKRNLRPPEKS